MPYCIKIQVVVTMSWQPDKKAFSHLYLQIKQYVVDKIVSGEWPSGSKLPSQRTLAAQFNVNRSTVVAALNELWANGLIEGNAGGGTRVVDKTWDFISKTTQPNWNAYITSAVSQANSEIMQMINEYEFRDDIIRMGSCEPSFDLIPSDEMADILQDIPKCPAAWGYLEPKGYIELRKEVCEYLRRFGIETEPESVLIVSGALQALQLISLGLLHQGSLIYIEKPSYLYSLKLFHSAGVTLSGISLDDEGINISELRERNRARRGDMLFSIPTFHNPTGVVTSAKRRRELIDLCGELQLPIVEDDVYSEVWFEEAPPNPLKAFDKASRVLYVNSMSKNLCPGLRVGWVVGAKPVIDRLADVKMQFDYGSSSLSQWLAAEVFKRGLYDRHNEQLRKAVRAKRDATLKALERSFSDIASWNTPAGGYYVWLQLKKPVSMHELFTKSLRAKLLVQPGDLYKFQSNTNIRISYSYTSLEEIEAGLEVLAKVIKELYGE